MGRGHSAVRTSSRITSKGKRPRSSSAASLGTLRSRIRDAQPPQSGHDDVAAPASSTWAKAALTMPTDLESRARSASMRANSRHRRGASSSAAAATDATATIPSPSKAIRELVDEDFVPSEDENETIRRPDVLTKYKMAGKVLDQSLAAVVAACVAGASTKALCDLGDRQMTTALASMFRHSKDETTGRRIKKGIAFPCTVCVNDVLCHHRPFTDADGVILKLGDIVKVHMSLHVDGYPVTAATTILVGADVGQVPATQADANTVSAAFYALKGLIPLMRAGANNDDLTKFIESVGESFEGVQPVEGVLSNRTKRWMIDANDAIITKRIEFDEPQQDVDTIEVKADQIWTLDVAFCDAPSCRMQTRDDICNIYRRNSMPPPAAIRLPAGEALLQTIREDFDAFAFHALQARDPLKARLGLTSLKKMDLVDAFPELKCRKGGITARFSCTIAITKQRVHVLAGAPELQEAFAAAAGHVHPVVAAAAEAPLGQADDARRGRRRTERQVPVPVSAD